MWLLVNRWLFSTIKHMPFLFLRQTHANLHQILERVGNTRHFTQQHRTDAAVASFFLGLGNICFNRFVSVRLRSKLRLRHTPFYMMLWDTAIRLISSIEVWLGWGATIWWGLNYHFSTLSQDFITPVTQCYKPQTLFS